MYDLLEEETTTSLTKELGDASTGATLFTQRGVYCGRGRGRGRGGRGVCGGRGGHGGHGGSSGTGVSHKSKCTYSKIDSHTTDACRKRKCAQEGENKCRNDEHICFQCGLPGHIKVDCVFYKHVKEWWKVKKGTATAALATTGDYDPFWISGSALTATTTVAPKLVIDSGSSHHMWNDRTSVSMFKKLSLPIVIELGDHNSVTATHYGCINVIQGYQVEASHTPTFWLSLLSINQLHLGGHTTIFQDGKCSITSPSSCTLTGKLINGIYIIVSAIALLSSTTEYGKRRQRDCSPTIEPTIESSRAPIAVKTKSTQKSLTKSESRIWHQRLADMNPTAIMSLVKGYKNDDSLCTVCIQAKQKEEFIKVPVKRTMKPFEPVHSNMCGPFCTLTTRDNRYYILFIDDYTKYTSVWLLPIKKPKTCRSANQSFQARVNSMGYEITRFNCDNGQGECDNKTFRYVLVACSTIYKPCPPYAHHINGVTKRMICTITEKAWAMIIDTLDPIQFWGEAFETAVYLHQQCRIKICKEMTAMAIKHHTKSRMRCYMDLANRRTMLMATKCRIKPLSTMYIDSDAMPVDSFPKFNAARESSAQCLIPEWW